MNIRQRMMRLTVLALLVASPGCKELQAALDGAGGGGGQGGGGGGEETCPPECSVGGTTTPCPPKCFPSDVYIRDFNATGNQDIGHQPSGPSSTVFWVTSEVYNTQSPSGPHASAEYGQVNYLHATLRNSGGTDTGGAVRFYVGPPTTSAPWSSTSWHLVTPQAQPPNSHCPQAPGPLTVPHSPPVDMCIAWRPDLYLPSPGNGAVHFSVVAVFVGVHDPAPGFNDPQTGFNGPQTGTVVLNHDNVALRSLNEVDLRKGGKKTWPFQVGNWSPSAAEVRLVVKQDLTTGAAQDTYLDHGHMEIDLGEELFGLWKNGSVQVKGLVPTSGTAMQVEGPDASITIAAVPAGTEYSLEVVFSVDPDVTVKADSYPIAIVQEEEGVMIGGVSYDILLPVLQ